MDVLGIVLSLFLLMFFAYRGYSVILFSPIFALLAASLQGLPIMPAYTELFMGKAVVFVKGEEITQWVNCSIFGERGEKLINSLKKGSSVFVSGEFYARKWESNGKNGTSLELNVDRFKWAGRKHDSSDATQDHATQPVKREQAAPKTQVDDLDDDIPF